MEYSLPLNGVIDLDALDEYLMSDHSPDDSMGLSDLDGFLTGVVVGPELILPSEWCAERTQNSKPRMRCGRSLARSWAGTMR